MLKKLKKNKKGQTLGVSIIIAITIFLIGFSVLNILKPEITRVRSSDGLDCSNVSISDGTKLTCLVTDTQIPVFILAILSIVIGIISARFVI